MRVGTWNLDGRWTDRHRAFLEALACDVLLLTEVRTDLDLPGYEIRPSAEMVEGRWWAAVASPQTMVALEPPQGASAMAEIDGWLRVCSSVLPWNGCAPFWPWHDGGTAEKTADAIVGIEAGEPHIWGGDWNHSLLGQETAGAMLGRMAILDALDRLGLDPATAKLRHRSPGVRTIDHIAVPTAWQVTTATRVDATALSDHDAYVVETTPAGGPTSS